MNEQQKPSYSYQPRPMGAGYLFQLSPQTLDWSMGAQTGQIAYTMIRHVRLGYKPTGMAGSRYIAEIWATNAPKLVLYSTSMQSLINTVDQGAEYSAFLRELHKRMAAAKVQSIYQAGFAVWRWLAAVIVAIITVIALLYVVVRGFAINEFLVSGGMVLIGAWFLWQVWNIVVRNRPQTYTPDKIPAQVLPG